MRVHSRARPRSAGRRLLALLRLAGVGGIVLACAQPVPPSGGPVDTSAPAIAATSPALYEANVAPDRPLRVVFSEAMDHGSVEDGIVVRPGVDWGFRSWRSDTLVLVPREGWAESTTYSVLLRRTIADQRRNVLTESAIVVFSTGAPVATGRISGRLERIGVSAGDVLILAFDGWTTDTTRVDTRAAVSVAEPDAGGRFLLAGLEVGRAHEVGAFFDVNENRDFDPGTDLYCRALAPVVPDSGGGPSDVRVVLVFADEPGQITGTVMDSTCTDLVALGLRLSAGADSLSALRDSLWIVRSTLLARADSLLGQAVAPEDTSGTGAEVTAGELRERGRRLRDEAERLVLPDSVAIARARALPPEASGDSVYCAQPIIARFRAVEDTTRFEDRPFGPAPGFLISDVPPGRYLGRVWRDLDGDAEYDPDLEPGLSEEVSVWVPPGQSGVVDTVRIARPRVRRMEER